MAEPLDLSGVTYRLGRPVYRYHQYQGTTNDCGPTSLAIAANTLLGGERLHGPEVAKQMSRPSFEWRPVPHISLRRIPGWITFPWGIASYLRNRGLPARWHAFGTVDRLRQNLLRDRITLVAVGEPLRWRKWRYAGWAHIKVLYGYTPGEGFLFVDPGSPVRDNDPWAAHGLFWQGEEAFHRQWRNLLRIYIEAG
ncbi:MAG: C39 family peptidase [Anaerolineae bacterium]